MSLLSSFGAGLREFFTLAHARETVRAYRPEQHELVAAFADAAASRLRASREATVAAAGAELARQALIMNLRSRAVAKSGADGEVELAAELDAYAAGPAVTASAEDIARARDALSTDPLYFDRLEPGERQAVWEALDHVASAVASSVESRSLPNITATRWGRTAALVLVGGYAAWSGVRAVVMPKNLARDKPVAASSVRPGTPATGKDLVDGVTSASYGIHTNSEQNPWVMIDLEAQYRVDTIKVYNRTDGWFDDCLPLVAEISDDGITWSTVARRDDHFSHDPPWTIDAHQAQGRYVRLRVDRYGYMAIGEVEVFGHP